MMALKQILGVLLLVSFLFSNNGITIYANTCPMSGQVTFEYFMNSCCCSGEAGSGCCETTVDHVKYNPEGYFTPDIFQPELAQDLDFVPLSLNVHEVQKTYPLDIKEKVIEYPPPNFLPHGRQLLIELETLII